MEDPPLLQFFHLGNSAECDEQENYFPSMYNNAYHIPIKTLRLVIHVFNDDNGNGNFQPEHAGYFTDLINSVNQELANLQQPTYDNINNVQPDYVPDARIRFKLEATHFWNDTRGYNPTTIPGVTDPNAAAVGTLLYQEYVTNGTLSNVERDSALHVFILGPGPASGRACDIPCNEWVQMLDFFDWWDGYFHITSILHEVGHCLGLVHTWSPNGSTSCVYTGNTVSTFSNNIMNGWPNRYSLSSCQLAIIHNNIIENRRGLRDILVKDYCEKDESQTITINSGEDVVWNAARYLHGDVIIKGGGKLTILCLTALPKEGKIIVERGGLLVIDGGIITNVCGDLWWGIELWGNSAQSHPALSQVYNFSNGSIGSYPNQSYHQGVVILRNNAVISNAIDAISTMKREDGWSNSDYWGGIVIADHSTFRNNKRSVEFMKFDYNNISQFRNCTFETDGPLNGGVKPSTFVSMWAVKNVRFRECTFINRPTSVAYYSESEKGTGIIAVESTPKIEGVCIAYSLSTGGCAQYLPNVFENLYTGVKFSNCSGPATVTGNRFIKNFYGIDLFGTANAQVFGNYIETGTSGFNTQQPIGINGLGSYNIKIEQNNIVISQNAPGRGIYFQESGQYSQRIYKNTVSGGNPYNGIGGMAFAYGNGNDNLVNYCNKVTDPMIHFMLFKDGRIYEKQGDCDAFVKKPAGNIFDPICNSTSRFHFYTGHNAAYFNYCDGLNSGLDDQCVLEFSNFRITQANQSANCASKIIELGINSGGFYGKRAEQATLTGLIKDQYALLDGGRTAEILHLAIDEDYSSDQLYDTLINYTPFLSDDVLVATLFREEFKSTNALSHLLIENAPHSNLIWKAIAEGNHTFNSDSLEKLHQYQPPLWRKRPLVPIIL